MRSPRIEGPPVLQPVTGSPHSAANRDSIETPIDDHASDDGEAATPPMPILVEGEDFGDDDDGSSFELVEEISSSKLNNKDSEGEEIDQEPPLPLSNGLQAKDEPEAPVIADYSHDDRINGDHEEPVLEKFFRLFTPGAQAHPKKDVVNDVLSTRADEPSDSIDDTKNVVDPDTSTPPPLASISDKTPTSPTSSKRRRQSAPKAKAVSGDRSPSPKRPRSKYQKDSGVGSTSVEKHSSRGRPPTKSKASEVFEFASENEMDCQKVVRKSPQRRPPKPKAARDEKSSPTKGGRKGQKGEEAQKLTPAATAIENRYLRSPYIISTAENDSIMSRFQVVNPAFRDAASVNVLDHPFKHSVKLPPHAGLAKSAWVCVFCGLGTAFSDLGCLFGPYYIDFNKFTAHADLISTADNTQHCSVERTPKGKSAKEPDPPSSPRIPSTATSSLPASPVIIHTVQEDKTEEVLPSSETTSEQGIEVGGAGKGRRTMRRLSSNNTPRLTSISSFRSSRTRNSQTLIAAKDVRRCSVDSDKGNSNIKQLDIAAMFFSSGEQPTEKKEIPDNTDNVKVNGKEIASRRKSDAGKDEEPMKRTREPKTVTGKSEIAPTTPVKAAARKKSVSSPRKTSARTKAPKSVKEKTPSSPAKRGKGRPPAAESVLPNNCSQAKASRGRDRQKPETSAERCSETRIAANGEVWMHLECVMWASGTYLNGKQIVGLEEALSEALQTVCKVCHLRGAILACVQRGCDRTFHYYCAVQDDCYLDHEQFCIYCSKHKKKCASQASSYWSGSANQTMHF